MTSSIPAARTGASCTIHLPSRISARRACSTDTQYRTDVLHTYTQTLACHVCPMTSKIPLIGKQGRNKVTWDICGREGLIAVEKQRRVELSATVKHQAKTHVTYKGDASCPKPPGSPCHCSTAIIKNILEP